MTFFELQIDRMERMFWYIMAVVMRDFIRVKNNRIFFYAYDFDKYSCNPRSLTEYILENHPHDFEIIWAFDKKFDASIIDKRIKVVRLNTFKYLFAMYSSKFIINNRRAITLGDYFVKKSNQKYLMLWHGSFPLKKIEKDVAEELGTKYVKRAKNDSRMCDLMISDSFYFENIIRRAFWYNGEILRSGVPRNDIFYNHTLSDKYKNDVRKRFNIPQNGRIVLYAPTFRRSKSIDYYKLNWTRVIDSLEQFLGGPVTVFFRLHPLLSKFKNIEYIINDSRIYNVTSAPDITEFLFTADAMISDYTSAMFDFSRLQRPCFIYAIDSESYNRGFYLSLDDLPFPVATNEDELVDNIQKFDIAKYKSELAIFTDNKWQLFEDGHACENIYNWIRKNL